MPRSGTASNVPGNAVAGRRRRSGATAVRRRCGFRKGCTPTPIANPGPSARSRQRRTRRPWTTSTTCASRGRGHASSRPARASSYGRSASSATPATDGPLRESGAALATWLCACVFLHCWRVSPEARFCSACGAAPQQWCPSCRTAQPAGAAFCFCVWSNTTRRRAPSCGWRRARGAPHRELPCSPISPARQR